MRRFQLLEIEDQRWFPSMFRNFMTDFLRTVAEKFNLFGPAVPIIADLLQRTGKTKIIDLASGGGGQWRTLLPQVRELVPGTNLVLTDLYPNVAAFEKIASQSRETIDFETRQVSATEVPDELSGLRTMFLSLHHFEPDDASNILKDAVRQQAPIAIFEAQCRDFEHLIKFALSPIMVLILTPFIRPFSFLRLLFTYLIPVVPLTVGFDGVVSVLRTYNPEELTAFASQADPEQAFDWKAKVVKHGQQKITYMIGCPKAGA